MSGLERLSDKNEDNKLGQFRARKIMPVGARGRGAEPRPRPRNRSKGAGGRVRGRARALGCRRRLPGPGPRARGPAPGARGPGTLGQQIQCRMWRPPRLLVWLRLRFPFWLSASIRFYAPRSRVSSQPSGTGAGPGAQLGVKAGVEGGRGLGPGYRTQGWRRKWSAAVA